MRSLFKEHYKSIFLIASILVFFIISKLLGIVMFIYYIWKFSSSTVKIKTTITLVILIVPIIMVLFSLGLLPYRNFEVSGNSMSPALLKDSLIIVKRVESKNINRGEIIILDSPINEKVQVLRRVLGLPGDVVKVASGSVYLNNQLVHQYDFENATVQVDDKEVRVPENSIFVLADNLQEGADSRSWGEIPYDYIHYKYIFCYYRCSKTGN